MAALPAGQATVEGGDVVVTEPAQQPPQPRGEYAAFIIISDHPGRCGNTAGGHFRREYDGIGQWVAAVEPGRRARQVAVEMQEQGSGNKRFGMGLCPVIGLPKVMAAVEDPPIRIADVLRQLVRPDQPGPHAGASSSSQAKASSASAKTRTSAETKAWLSQALQAT